MTLFGMKKLVAPGRTLIVSQPKFSRGRRFDRWHTHAAAVFALGAEPHYLSGASIIFEAQLKDGSIWVYLRKPGLSQDEAYSLADSYRTFVSANGYVGYVGEWFNYVFRGTLNAKLTPDEWETYDSTPLYPPNY